MMRLQKDTRCECQEHSKSLQNRKKCKILITLFVKEEVKYSEILECGHAWSAQIN